jgi:hypothetical protein
MHTYIYLISTCIYVGPGRDALGFDSIGGELSILIIAKGFVA